MRVIEWKHGNVRFLDQRKLPLEESFIETSDVNVIADAIKRLAIRGAPLIGVAAAYGVALAVHRIKNEEEALLSSIVQKAIDLLSSTRPTAVNLFWALQRMNRVMSTTVGLSVASRKKGLLNEALKIHREDEEMCEAIGRNGAALLLKKCTVLTHCNTGSLATGGNGTALNIIRHAWEQGKVENVYIDETRPLLQGARLTAWELKKMGIPHTLILDNTAAFLMQQKKIDCVVVGADRIAANGDVANKVGTYSIGVLAKHHGIPFYVAAPISTIDFGLRSGEEIPIEIRDGSEVINICGARIAPDGVSVYSPAFDITPNNLISAIISDKGVAKPPYDQTIHEWNVSEKEGS